MPLGAMEDTWSPSECEVTGGKALGVFVFPVFINGYFLLQVLKRFLKTFEKKFFPLK